MTETIDDARATVRTAIISALATTCEQTGIRAGAASDVLVDEILRELEDISTRWALAILAQTGVA